MTRLKQCLLDYTWAIVFVACLLTWKATVFFDGYLLGSLNWRELLPLLFMLALPLLVFIVTLYVLVSLFKKTGKAKKIFCNVLISVFAFYVLTLPIIPDDKDGMVIRLSDYSEQDFLAIAKSIESAFEKNVNEAKYFGSSMGGYGDFMQGLKRQHDFFSLSPTPSSISINDDFVKINWPKGFDDVYSVVISANNEISQSSKDADVTYLYDNVGIYLISYK